MQIQLSIITLNENGLNNAIERKACYTGFFKTCNPAIIVYRRHTFDSKIQQIEN